MKLFITGASGFIGSHLTNLAKKQGYEIIALKRGNIKNQNLDENITWLNKNLLEINTQDLEKVDVLFNLASAGVSPKKVSIQELTNTNVIGPIKLMEEAIKANVKRCVFAGTCHEYGLSSDKYKKIPINAPLIPTNNYARSKVASFFMLEALCKSYKTELIYPRIFSAYGLGQNDMNFWPSLRNAALNGSDFKMTKGTQIRDFIPVEEVVQHLINCCLRSDVVKGVPLVINIGSGNPISIIDFAKQEWQRLNAKGKLLNGSIPDRKNEANSFVPDIHNLYEKDIN